MQAAVQKVHRPSEENSQLPTFSLIMYDAGDIACDVSRVTTKAPCEAPAIHGRHVWNHSFRFARFFAATIYSCTYRILYILQICDMLSVYNDSHHQRWHSIKYARKESIASC